MAAIRSFAPFADPRGVSGCPGRGRGGVYCCRSVWVGGRSLWEDRDKPCLLSIRRHQRSIRRHQGTPISQARSAVVHDRWFREPTSLPRVPFSSASEKIPRLGTYLLFLSWHSRKAPFLEKTGRNVLLFFFFSLSVPSFHVQTKPLVWDRRLFVSQGKLIPLLHQAEQCFPPAQWGTELAVSQELLQKSCLLSSHLLFLWPTQ